MCGYPKIETSFIFYSYTELENEILLTDNVPHNPSAVTNCNLQYIAFLSNQLGGAVKVS